MSEETHIQEAIKLLQNCSGKNHNTQERIELSIELATLILDASHNFISHHEKNQERQLQGLVHDAKGLQFTTALTDECFRSSSHARITNQVRFRLAQHGVPQYLSTFKRFQLQAYTHLKDNLAEAATPLLQRMIRKETAQVILPAEKEQLRSHVQKRRHQGICSNINHLGEAILSEPEAERRIQAYLKELRRPHIEYISVKISTLTSQINLLAWDDTLDLLDKQLSRLYHEALEHKTPDGQSKFINLDMEEYSDLDLTVALFKKTLSRSDFQELKAGIALQAYIPNSLTVLKDLTNWALERVMNGGAPIKIRLVKGANMAMESVDASHHSWPLVTYENKMETDANYRRMLDFATREEHKNALHLGVASHNLFEIAHALVLVYQRQSQTQVNFEMLEGMAPPLRRVLLKIMSSLTLYCPVSHADNFQSSIAYLIRRLDENTAPQNFMRASFGLTSKSAAFKQQSQFFTEAFQLMPTLNADCLRTQDRHQAQQTELKKFRNTANTDLSLKINRKWAKKIYQKIACKTQHKVYPCIAGENVFSHHSRPILSPNHQQELGQCNLATKDQLEHAIETCTHYYLEWMQFSIEERSELVYKCARLLETHRHDLITTMISEVGKNFAEADGEVSEAIDFCNYYAKAMLDWKSLRHLDFVPLGTVLICPPWNFPIAISTGGIISTLVTGNTVLFKPAPEASLCGQLLCQIFYEAGIPKNALQFVPCEDETGGSLLVGDERIKLAVLTGATETAKKFLQLRPFINLTAETGGKNIMIISAMCDRDLAIRDLIHSAFFYSGQKCSACSIALIEREIYEDPHFLQNLRDASSSLHVSPADNPQAKITPIIHEASDTLQRALNSLDNGEEWLLEPKIDLLNPQLISPGIKIHVKPGSFSFTTEFFAPVLCLIPYDSLDQAIDIANSSPYGLSGGLHSLDSREQREWLDNINIGNAYINRTITGAAVQRQPFGGCKNSSYGPGYQAGGPHYLLQFMHVKELYPEQKEAELNEKLHSLLIHFHSESQQKLSNIMQNYLWYWKNYFNQLYDPSQLVGQHNYTIYKSQVTRYFIQDRDSRFTVACVIAACRICKAPLTLYASAKLIEDLKLLSLLNHHEKLVECDEEKAPNYFSRHKRLRTTSPAPEHWKKTAVENFTVLHSLPLYTSGRLELLNYLRAMSVSDNYHRYGNLNNQ